MSIEIKVPNAGESIAQVQIAEWLKSEGDPAQKDEPIVVLDSEKTTFELPAPKAGRLTKILQTAGATVSIGSPIALFEPAEGQGTEIATLNANPTPAPTAAADQNRGKDSTQASPRPSRNREPASNSAEGPSPASPREPATQAPEVNRAPSPKPAAALPNSAAEAGEPSEPAEPAQATKPAEAAEPVSAPRSSRSVDDTAEPGDEEVVPMTSLRRTISRRLVEARQSMAMLTTFNEIDLHAIQQLRRDHQKAFQEERGIRLGLMSFFVKAAIDGLRRFPQLNASVRGDSIVYHNYFDIGIAVATDRGLVVPVLRRAERSSFAEIEQTIADFARRAAASALTPADLSGGTFTITNGGIFGSLLSTPIINPPQSAILGLHAIEDRPVARDGQVVVRPMMYVALTYDHRVADGRDAALFLRRLRDVLETPARMLIEA